MKTENAITEYWNEIRTGGVVVGKWIRMLYDVLMQGISENRWFYDDSLAQNAVGFIERFCHHYKGQLAPRRIRLDLWERAGISDIFGIVDGSGKRQFSQVFWPVGRKQGKRPHSRHRGEQKQTGQIPQYVFLHFHVITHESICGGHYISEGIIHQIPGKVKAFAQKEGPFSLGFLPKNTPAALAF